MRIIILLVMLLFNRQTFAGGISATVPIADKETGKIVGYHTDEQSVYFLIPSHWSTRENTHGRAVFVTPASDGNFDVRFAVAADYSHAAASVLAIRAQDPAAMFFPMPRIDESLQLFLPDALGVVQAKMEPDGGLTSVPVSYYRIRISQDRFDTLVQLAQSALSLTGAATVTYRIGGEEVRSTQPMTIRLNSSELGIQSAFVDDSPSDWLGSLLATHRLRHSGSLDGKYYLGGVLAATLSQSVLTGGFVDGAISVSQAQQQVVCSSLKSANFSGELSFVIAELDTRITLDFWATVELVLDMQSLSVLIPRFEMNSVSLNGHISDFYTQLIKSFLAKDDVRKRLSATVTQELQRRILAQTLFGIHERIF